MCQLRPTKFVCTGCVREWCDEESKPSKYKLALCENPGSSSICNVQTIPNNSSSALVYAADLCDDCFKVMAPGMPGDPEMEAALDIYRRDRLRRARLWTIDMSGQQFCFWQK